MNFRLSERSRSNLVGVRQELVDVIEFAINITEVDFCVLEGLRSKERQEQLVKSGASKTLDSRHLTGHAVDLAPFVSGEVRHDWTLCYKIALAMKHGAKRHKANIVWGGVWDKSLNLILDPHDEVANYVLRRRSHGKKAFIDGYHFELDRRAYPSSLHDLIK